MLQVQLTITVVTLSPIASGYVHKTKIYRGTGFDFRSRSCFLFNVKFKWNTLTSSPRTYHATLSKFCIRSRILGYWKYWEFTPLCFKWGCTEPMEKLTYSITQKNHSAQYEGGVFQKAKNNLNNGKIYRKANVLMSNNKINWNEARSFLKMICN